MEIEGRILTTCEIAPYGFSVWFSMQRARSEVLSLALAPSPPNAACVHVNLDPDPDPSGTRLRHRYDRARRNSESVENQS
ncbi:hypothetical protein [Phreatobacter stygius]|uniref:Uncharacterized protein n=1 Tax=Phreatobacter stygius TaxID=1940610 RepID=A0A4D7BGT5_9HYPH|nr:hypothetical protein [Phreatobacter stygius]QCI67072.1 hypothetical protein E8M01_24225 [Phreatobacter stygius]